MLDVIKNWKFMDESLMQWFIFLIAFTLLMFAWKTILGYMQETIREI